MQFLTTGGVFSKSDLDQGSRLLIETLTLPADSKFCDLGCGWGPVGSFMGSTVPSASVWACDINPRAVQLANWNFRLNKIQNTVAWCGAGLSAVRSEFFDSIACNPPIRAGNATIEKLFDDAFRCLRSGGSFWVVIRTAQGAKSWQKRLAAQFGDCQTITIDHGYRILKAEK